jgi:hypothetical protein
LSWNSQISPALQPDLNLTWPASLQERASLPSKSALVEFWLLPEEAMVLVLIHGSYMRAAANAAAKLRLADDRGRVRRWPVSLSEAD